MAEPSTPTRLEKNVRRVARAMAVEQLNHVAKAGRRLGRTTDPEALHDLRVRLRRLRALLRGYADHLQPGLRKKTVARLRKLARRTNPCRDGQVHLAMLHEHLGDAALDVRKREAVAWLLDRMQTRHDLEMASLRREWGGRFEKVGRRLRRDLSRAAAHRGRGGDSFLQVTARLLDAQADRARSQLATLADDSSLHELRLGVKRLRCLLDPLRGEVEGAAEATTGFKALQDQLGMLHDLEALAERLGDEAEQAAGEWSDQLTRQALGRIDRDARSLQEPLKRTLDHLWHLGRLVRDRRSALLAELGPSWPRASAERELARIKALAARILRPEAAGEKDAPPAEPASDSSATPGPAVAAAP